MCTRTTTYQRGSTRRLRSAWPFFVFALTLGLGALFANAQPAAAALPAPTACRTDLKGVDQSKGGANDQGDLTQFCLSSGNTPYDFYASWSWDESDFGSQSGDGCLLFDSDNDGLVNYAVCVAVTGLGQLQQTKLYSCNNTRPENCDSPQPITAVNTTCETSVKANDPFKPGQQDTVAVCGVALSDFNAAGLTLIDACSYTSSSPSSDARDCILFKGGCGSDADCNDNDSCTTDTCNLTDPNNSFCQFTPNSPGSCNDLCTTGGTCDPSGFCQGGTPVSCDDQNACTNDSCSPATGCVNVSNGSCNDPCAGVDCSGSSDACSVGVCVVNNGQAECQKQPANEGGSCDDGDACTQTDKCQSGVCTGSNPVVCAPLDQCHMAGTCDPASGQCSNPPAQDGTSCNDGDACTQTDTCQSGACVGSNPVVCTPLDQCHVAGTCDPTSGQCSNPSARDGTGCNDGNACTTGDSCQVGACVGAPVVCTAQDQCHIGGTCNPATGQCSNPNAPDGTGCSDGNACTQTDTCQSGSCVGSNPVTCTAQDQCHDAGTCNTATGQCSNPAKADGTSCNDHNACTTVDQCKSGSCVGSTPPNCDDNNVCTVDSCDPATGCTHPAGNKGTECRKSAGECDPAEVCNGTSTSCPTDLKKAAGTSCTADSNVCTLDQCDGTSALCQHPAGNSGTVCRPAASDCDIADKCTGVDIACSADATSCQPKDTPKIEPTATTCQQFRDGTVLPLVSELYTLKSGKINSISPGVFFVYDTVHLSANGPIYVTESNSTGSTPSSWTQTIGVHQSQVVLYDLNCNAKSVGTLKVDTKGNVTITGVPAGDYILSVKYDPTTLSGYAPLTPSTTYKFQVQAGVLSSGNATVAVNKK